MSDSDYWRSVGSETIWPVSKPAYLAEAKDIEGLEQLHAARKVADPLAFIRDLEEANRQMRELVNRTVHRNSDIHMENLALRRELSRLRMPAAAVDEPPTDAVVSKRVDEVIDDLGKGRVVPKDQTRIADAVGRARTDSAVGRALGKGYQR